MCFIFVLFIYTVNILSLSPSTVFGVIYSINICRMNEQEERKEGIHASITQLQEPLSCTVTKET